MPELRPPADPPKEPAAAAAFWTEHHAARWARAVELERETGLAVIDTDPLKLHYAWSLWRVGAGSREDFEAQAGAYREAITDGRIGFADRVLVSIPDAQALGQRRDADTTRQRRNFDLHARLAEPLRAWYTALDRVRPGSVEWNFAPAALGDPSDVRDRYSLGDFDALLQQLVPG